MQLPQMRLVREFIVLQLAQEAACSESLISILQHGAASPIAVHAASACGGAGYGYRQAGIGANTTGRTYPSSRRGASHQGRRHCARTAGAAHTRATMASQHTHTSAGRLQRRHDRPCGEEVGYALEGARELRVGRGCYTPGRRRRIHISTSYTVTATVMSAPASYEYYGLIRRPPSSHGRRIGSASLSRSVAALAAFGFRCLFNREVRDQKT